MSDANGVKAPTPAAHKRDRSPNYPGIGPTEALVHAEKIWKQDKRNPLSVDMACKHLGYKAKNGASLPIIGALRRYGLLVNQGAEVRISDEANTIFLAPPGHPDRVEGIRRVAMRPALFAEVLKSFPDGLPSNANLIYKLQKDWHFANDKAAENFVEALRDAVAISSVAGGGERADTAAEIDAEEPETNMQPHAISGDKIPQPQRIPPPHMPPAPPAAPTQTRSWDLGGGAVIFVTIPLKLSKGNIEKLKKYVAALETEASISWDDE